MSVRPVPGASEERVIAEHEPPKGLRRPAAALRRVGAAARRPTREGSVIPEATVARLATYLRVLSALREQSVETVSSEELAAAAGVNAGLLRKDLSYLGSWGTRGVGYVVDSLETHLARTLGLTEHRSVVLIGIGNLGQALAGYHGFASRGFRIVGLIDVDPARVGSVVAGLPVSSIDDLEDVVERNSVSIGVIATPASAAQKIADRLAAAGVTAILNFAPVVLYVPAHVDVRKVDLAGELQILSFHERRKSQLAVGAAPRIVSGQS